MTAHPWYCSAGHIMGFVVPGGDHSRLYLFRNALPSSPDAHDLSIAGEVFGDIAWRCSICGRSRKWCRDKRQRGIAIPLEVEEN